MGDAGDDVVDAIAGAPDDQALELEARAVAATDNGWQPGDPEDQPDNPDPWSP